MVWLTCGKEGPGFEPQNIMHVCVCLSGYTANTTLYTSTLEGRRTNEWNCKTAKRADWSIEDTANRERKPHLYYQEGCIRGKSWGGGSSLCVYLCVCISLCLCLYTFSLSFRLLETWSHVAQADLEVLIFLPPSQRCWDYSCRVSMFFLN